MSILFLLISFFVLPTAWSNCDLQEDAIELPEVFQDTDPCFKMRGALSLKRIDGTDRVKIDTPEIAFSGVPSPSVLHYVKVDKKDGKPAKVMAMTYLCSGEVPIASEATSYLIDETGTDHSGSEIFIESGTEITSLGDNKKKKLKIYEEFFKVFESKIDSESAETHQVYIPDLILNPNSYSERIREVLSFYLRMTNSPLNACKKSFRDLMGNHLLRTAQGPGPHQQTSFEIQLSH